MVALAGEADVGRDLAGQAVLAILTRAPSAGGKSRLFAALGRDADPELLTALLLDTVDAASSPDVTLAVVVEPPRACDEVRALLPNAIVIAQEAGPLGDRMAHAMRELFDRGARAVALIGSDLPDLPAGVAAAAVAALDRDPDLLVLGPAADGGYYLIAAARLPPVFQGIEWGEDRVLAQTLAAAERHRWRVRLLEKGADVDTPADLRRVRAARTHAWVTRHNLG